MPSMGRNFYCIWRASYRTIFFSPTKGRAFMKNETPPVSISFSQNASFIFFHLFPLISNGYMFHKKNIKNSASTLHRVIPSKQGVPEINSCAYWLIWMLRNLNWITTCSNFELWVEQRMFNSFIDQQPHFHKGSLNL